MRNVKSKSMIAVGCGRKSHNRIFVSAAAATTSVLLMLLLKLFLGLVLSGGGSGWVVAAVAVVDALGSEDEQDTCERHTPAPAPGPDTPIEYPIRVFGTEAREELPDDKRCRWLPSGPDAWVANRTATSSDGPVSNPGKEKSNSTLDVESNANEKPANTMDGMFRRIVRIYQEDETLRDKLTIASSPDSHPPKIESDYRLEEDGEQDEEEEKVEKYLHEGDGGPWVLLIDDFLSGEEATQLAELGMLEGYQESTIGVDEDEDEDDEDEDEDNDEEYEDDENDDNDKNSANDNNNENDDKDDDNEDYEDEETNDDHDEYDGDKAEETKVRDSSTAWCESDACTNNEVYKAVIDRIYDLVGIGYPYSEDMQLLHYSVGQFYRKHHDFGFIDDPVERSQEGGRILTVFLYLNDVEGGGGTEFPRLNLTVTPKRGKLVVWPSKLDKNISEIDWRMEHAALEVTAGVKYGANVWFWKKPYQHQWFNYECDAPVVEDEATSPVDFGGIDAYDDAVSNGGVIWHDDFDAYNYDDDEYYHDDDGYNDDEEDDYEDEEDF